MDEDLKRYADTLYAHARYESSRTLTAEKKHWLGIFASRSPNIPLGGSQIKIFLGMYVEHIERCMRGRLESYQQAFSESVRLPTEQELQDIWQECQEVREMEATRANINLVEFIKTHGGAAYIPEKDLDSDSAHGHDRMLQQW